MKITEFVTCLKNLSGRAKCRMRQWLRFTAGEECLITEVAKSKGFKFTDCHLGCVDDSAHFLGLSDKLQGDIIAAADCGLDTEDLTKTQRKYLKLFKEALDLRDK